MGREVRMVPPNWEHPKVTQIRYKQGQLQHVEENQPMFNHSFADAARVWREGFAKWEAGERAEHLSEDGKDYEYWEWEGPPPDKKYYRPWRDEEATWFQLWETVSEGTPVTPPFATREELAAYLAKNGDEWDQSRGEGGWGEKRANAFVADGWAPSFAIMGGVLLESKDIPAHSAAREGAA